MKTARRILPRKAVNVSVRQDLIRAARRHDINLSRLLEEAIDRRLRLEAGRKWQEENREAIEHFNRRIERDGLLSDDFRPF